MMSLVIQEEFDAHHYILALLTSERSFVMVGIDVTLKKYLNGNGNDADVPADRDDPLNDATFVVDQVRVPIDDATFVIA